MRLELLALYGLGMSWKQGVTGKFLPFYILDHTDKVSWKNIFSAVGISVLSDSCDHSEGFCVTWLELLFDMFFYSH